MISRWRVRDDAGAGCDSLDRTCGARDERADRSAHTPIASMELDHVLERSELQIPLQKQANLLIEVGRGGVVNRVGLKDMSPLKEGCQV